jgi:hypothetical protein
MSEPQGKLPEKLQPGSWTEAEVDALQGHQPRFKNSGASGRDRQGCGCPRGSKRRHLPVCRSSHVGRRYYHPLEQGRLTARPVGFHVLPGPPVSEEERLALPEWGTGNAADHSEL